MSTTALELAADRTNQCTQDCQAFQVELRKSERGIRDAEKLQRRTEAVARLRKQQLLAQSRRKLRAHDQKRADASDVAQLVSDTLEYHDMLQTLETQVKRMTISAQREQERLAKSVRVALGRNDKHVNGSILGSGSFSQREVDALGEQGFRLGEDDNERHSHRDHERDACVYDLHGRRHTADESSDVTALGVFESAMQKIKRALDRGGATAGKRTGGDLVQLFRDADVDRSGALSRREFERVLATCGVVLTKQQVAALLEHYDPNRSGMIDYGELLWGFFNRRLFLKKWQLRKTTQSAREVELVFNRYDRTGRGALSVRDFQLAMDDIGFKLADDELKLLMVQFDTNRDGFIDYHEFHAFVSGNATSGRAAENSRYSGGDGGGGDDAAVGMRGGRRERRRATDASDGQAERILAELRALADTQSRIHQSIRDPFTQT